MKISALPLQLTLLTTPLIAQAFGDVTVQAEKLVDFIGCSTPQQKEITDAWDSAMDIAYVSSGKINWDYHAAEDFLGWEGRNKNHQNTIKAVLNNAYTFRRAYWWNPKHWSAWKVSIRCDDFHGTCKRNPTAPAYTVNPGRRYDGRKEVDKDTIAICPKKWKVTETCGDALKGPGRRTKQSTNLNDYLCRGYVMLHEMFHLDSLSGVSDGGHISDLKVYYQSGFDPQARRYSAYGPTRTRVLALWPNDDVGKYVVTNADNLALYSLARWIQNTEGRLYPNLPRPDGRPDTKYAPSEFKEDVVDDNEIPVDTNAVSLPLQDYLLCNNNGGTQWQTAPGVPQPFAQSTMESFCDNINSKDIGVFDVPDTQGTKLYLGVARRESSDPECTVLKKRAISTEECKTHLNLVINNCDTNSITRKLGGISTAKCMVYIAHVEGKRAAVKDLERPFDCSILVEPDSLNCACTDGELYPLKNGGCGYGSPPAKPAPSTIEIIPVPTTPATPPPPPAAAPDMSSEACNKCTVTLGASTCSGNDGQCLIDQCNNDDDCKECKIDCKTFG